MVRGTFRDRLVGSAFMGAIWTILCVPIVSGFNPVRGFLEELGPVAVLTLPLLMVFWSATFLGLFSLLSRRQRS
jgi:hypothetical protein